jgi:hypothetical protein
VGGWSSLKPVRVRILFLALTTGCCFRSPSEAWWEASAASLPLKRSLVNSYPIFFCLYLWIFHSALSSLNLKKRKKANSKILLKTNCENMEHAYKYSFLAH